mmetsp:Transcript_30043/g.39530  ORF Transcript_30043/g.39530 Transcript_30043/m.39530 type:complete len:457 (+) Transcript_30043:76-1446(+)
MMNDEERSKKRQKRKKTSILEPIGYAKRLSSYDEKGVCGGAEVEDSECVLEEKIAKLVEMVRQSTFLVAHTGAGISTAAGIPDFRGAKGIWTLEAKGNPLPDHEPCWNNAVPTLTHMAIKGLHEHGKLHGVITQNIDGLHARSGLPEGVLSELHGNIFVEKCEKCNRKETRSFDIGGVGFNYTGRFCSSCGGPMIDNLLDWEDELPEEDYSRALDFVERSKAPGSLALCLGTSLQMDPSRHFPTKANQMVIVNLQSTPMDSKAHLVIHARTDEVMRRLMQGLGFSIPVYSREVDLVISHKISRKRNSKSLNYYVTSPEGLPCGFISHIQVEFPGTSFSPVCAREQPFKIKKQQRPRKNNSSTGDDANMVTCLVHIFWESLPIEDICLSITNPFVLEYAFPKDENHGKKRYNFKMLELNYNTASGNNNQAERVFGNDLTEFINLQDSAIRIVSTTVV